MDWTSAVLLFDLIVIAGLVFLLASRREPTNDRQPLPLSDEPPVQATPDSFCDSGCCR